MVAYTWPLLSLFWTFLMFAGVFLMIFFIIWCFIDNFRRRDHHGLAKAMWTIVILFIPIIGSADLHHRPPGGRHGGDLTPDEPQALISAATPSAILRRILTSMGVFVGAANGS